MHIVGHGSEGAQQLGNATLSHETLETYQTELSQIGSALTEDGDILLYGCNVASDQTGVDFIGKLTHLTGADIAASNDLTGANNLDGNWVLEAEVGRIETSPITFANFDSVLFSGTITFTQDGYTDPVAATDGEGGSVDISGIQIDIYGISDTNGTPTGSGAEYHDGDDWFGYPAIITSGGNDYDNGYKGMAIKEWL